MRRVLGAIMIAGLLMGGAACGSSGGSDSGKSDTTAAKSEEGSTTDSGNADVKAYCDAVDDYVAKVQEAKDDPAKASALTDEAKELSEKASALATAGLDSGDAQDVADCTKKSTDALMPS
jgi:outer membrane murein-binding lipoprotein Lpp